MARSLLNLDESVLPTAEGLYARTVGMWSQDDFLTMTADEAKKLLPIDDDMPLSGTISLVTMLGGLPTVDDCRIAFQDDGVRAALELACGSELVLYELQLARASAADVDRARQSFMAAEDGLMRQLDQVGTYHNWSLVHRAYRSWSQ